VTLATVPRLLGVVLAGGGSTRMGRDKALAPLAGRPMIAHVLDRLRPQVVGLAVAAGVEPDRFAELGVDAFGDRAEVRQGPLAGICAGLSRARTLGYDAIVTAPCDGPFLPLDLAARLANAAGPGRAALVRTASGLHPTFALWPLDAADEAERLLANGDGPLALAKRLGADAAIFESADAFANVNTPAELAAAERRLVASTRRA
jgi:molybdenum cofactor guanylyltransferase